MKLDLPERAAEVVRDRYDGESELAIESELRILATFDRQVRRRRRLPFVVIPLVAALMASAAWGIGSAKLRALVHLGGPAQPPSAAGPKAAPRVRPLPQPDKSSEAPSPSLEAPAPPASTSPPLPARSLPPKARIEQRASAVVEVPAPPPVLAPSAPSDSEISSLYRAAHQAQFSSGESARALQLWDRYLAAAPNGALSPEARYNRAITLVRLGRKAEAAIALEPFARGDYGGYRKAEATSLLEVLRPAPVPSTDP